MKIRPIKIKIDDIRHFTDVALVVDQEEFLDEVKHIKSVFKIHQPLSQEEYYSFIRSLSLSKKDRKHFDKVIEQARKKLSLPITFLEIIKKAAFCGIVESDDYSPAFLEYKESYFDDKDEIPDLTFSIVISPRVRDEDVLKALQQYRDQLGNITGIPEYEYIPLARDFETGKPAIKNYRKWYLSEKNGKSPKEIESMIIAKCPVHGNYTTKGSSKNLKDCTCYDESTMRKGIKVYKSLLRKSRTF